MLPALGGSFREPKHHFLTAIKLFSLLGQRLPSGE